MYYYEISPTLTPTSASSGAHYFHIWGDSGDLLLMV